MSHVMSSSVYRPYRRRLSLSGMGPEKAMSIIGGLTPVTLERQHGAF
jgi:hypothetical protein